MLTGTDLAWELVAGLMPEELCRNALVSYDSDSGAYSLKLFDFTVSIIPRDRRLFFPAPGHDSILEKTGSLPELQILSYLTGARDIPFSGELIKPSMMTGGQIYTQGTHVLPLSSLTEVYEGSPGKLIARGKEFGGEELEYGDASVRLFPFPRIPVVLILWKGDDEVPSNISLLFDSTSELHLPADILWSTALMTVQMML